MARSIQYQRAISYNTITTATVFKALHADGGRVWEWVYKTCEKIAAEGKRIAPENHPLNALHAGHLPPGVYKASFIGPTNVRGGNQHVTKMAARNYANHAAIVEFGKPYVRGRQVFSWALAVKTAQVNGRWTVTGRVPGGIVSTNQVKSWRTGRRTGGYRGTGGGYHVLERATKTVIGNDPEFRVRRMDKGFVRG